MLVVEVVELGLSALKTISTGRAITDSFPVDILLVASTEASGFTDTSFKCPSVNTNDRSLAAAAIVVDSILVSTIFLGELATTGALVLDVVVEAGVVVVVVLVVVVEMGVVGACVLVVGAGEAGLE